MFNPSSIMKLKEKILLYKIQTNRDAEAYGELYDLYIEKIYRFIFFKVNNKEEAEDLTSEVFLKAWNYLISEKAGKIKSFSGLIYQIARNILIDFYRHKQTNSEYGLQSYQDPGEIDKNYQKIELSLEIRKILQVIKKLKETYQEVLLLYYLDELSIKEIAEITNQKPVNIRVRLHRALKNLQKLLKNT